MKKKAEKPIKPFASAKLWEAWLAKNHASSDGLWLRFYKKGSGVKTVTYAEALDAALCYGWIDSQANKYDEMSYLQKFTPRGPKSVWSKINTGHVARLIKEKKMRLAGLKKVEEAKKDGRWKAAYASPSNLEMPPDLEAALAKNKKARAFYETLNKTNRYAIITRLAFAKKSETRAKRLDAFVKTLEKKQKLR